MDSEKTLLYLCMPSVIRFTRDIIKTVTPGNSRNCIACNLEELAKRVAYSKGIVMVGAQRGLFYSSAQQYVEWANVFKNLGLPVAAVMREFGGNVEQLPRQSYGVNYIIRNIPRVTTASEIAKGLRDFFGIHD